MEKIKNLSALRIVAFAVALAVVLGLASVMFSVTASAETADETVSQLGTLGNYDCIKFKAGQKIDFNTLYEQRNRYNSQYVIGAVFGYKNGKFVNFKNNNFSIRPQSTSEYYDVYFCGTTMYGNWVYGDKAVLDSVYYQYGVYNSSYNSMCLGVKDNEASVKGTVKLADSSQSFYHSVGDTLYLVYTGADSLWNTTQLNDFCNDIINSLTADNYKDFTPPPSGGSENGRFICFGDYKDYSYDEHLVDISNGCIHQLKDYDTKVKSYYTSFMFDSDDAAYSWVNKRFDENKIKTYKSKAIAFRFYNPDDSISSVRLRISRTMIMPTTRESNNPFDVPAFVTFHPANKHYSRYVVLSEGSLSSVPAKSTITARVDLQAYCDLYGNSTYLLELVNGKSNEVVSSVLMSYTGKDYDRFDSSGVNDANAGYIDVKYQLDKGNTVDNDVLIPDSDGVLPSLPNGIDDDTFKPSGNYDLSKVDITDIFATLNQSTASVGAFFQACFNILPATLVALILGSLALLIVLRVLGR